MIALKGLSGSEFALNADLIKRVKSALDTIIVIVDATKCIAEQTVTEVIKLIREDRACLLAHVEGLIQEDNQKTTTPVQLSVACSSPGKEE